MSDAAMAAVLNLGNIFELVIDSFNKRAPAQQALIEQRQEPIVHVFSKGSHQLKTLFKENLE